MNYDIFISYRRVDSEGRTSGRDIARTIKLELEKRGFKVFFDYSEIKDNAFENIILPAVRNSKVFISVLSKDALTRCSNRGDWVRREIETAIDSRCKIIPVNPDGAFDYIYPEELPESFTKLQVSDISMGSLFEISIDKLVQDRIRPEIEKRNQEFKRAQQAIARYNAEQQKKRQPTPPKKDSNFINKVKENAFPIIITIIVMALGLVTRNMCSSSSDNNKSKAEGKMETQIDTLSYAIGMAETKGLTKYLSETLNIDTSYIDDFVHGLYDLEMPSDQERRKAYQSGTSLKMQIENKMIPNLDSEIFGNNSTKKLNSRLFIMGFANGAQGNYSIMTADTAQQITKRLMHSLKENRLLKEYGDNKRAGEEFLKKNATKNGVVTLSGGTQYKVIKAGSGAIPQVSSYVTVHYEGKTIDGIVFDNSYKRGEPLTLQLNKAIQGWQDALTKMPEGSIWEIYIPQDRAYGERMQNTIKPYSVLIFKIELLKVK